MKKIIIIILILTLLLSDKLLALDPTQPLLYPKKIVTIKRPYIIWQDKNFDLNNKPSKFLITIKDKLNPGADEIHFSISPRIYFKEYFAFKIPFNLKDSTYDYKIERIVSNGPINLGYFYYMKYPINNQFTMDSSKENILDTLKPESLIEYLALYRENISTNVYHFWFLSAASSVFLGLGFVFLYATDYGIYSTVTYSILFGTAGAGFIAAGYFGIRYLINLVKLNKILKMGQRVSINGNFYRNKFYTEARISF